MEAVINAIVINPYTSQYNNNKSNLEDSQRLLETLRSIINQFSTPELDSLVNRVKKQVSTKQTEVTEKQRLYEEQSKQTYNWINDLLNVFIIIFVTLIILYGFLSFFFTMDTTPTQQQISEYTTFWDIMTQPFVRKEGEPNKELESLKDELTRLKTTKELNELKTELSKSTPSSWFKWF